jgi:uncharacterized protein YndB with AHSA1/START domain
MTDATPAPTMSEHRLTITRIFDAPRDLVWSAWTDPKQLARWWGPEHFHTPEDSVTVELQPGGAFKLTMVGPDGERYPSDGTFREVVEPERLVFGEDETCHPTIERAETTVTFNDLGDRTEMILEVTMVCSDELLRMAELGWGSQFDKLDGFLAER